MAGRRGSALLTVLWLSAALAAIGIAVASSVRSETERAATNLDDAKAYFLAEGAIQRIALRYFWGRDFFRPNDPAMDLSFPGGVVHVDIIPEGSKLSLNSARPEELVRLLEALGVSEGTAYGVAAAIADWRSPDPLHQSPFDAFYLSQSPSFLPRHASFQENEELLLVRGVTADLYYGAALARTRAGLRDCISVFGGGAVNVNTAQPAVFAAVGISPPDIADLVRLRSQAPILDGGQFASVVSAIGEPARRLGYGGDTIYTLRATARLRQPTGQLSDFRRTVAAVVNFVPPENTEGLPPGANILRWYDRP